MHELKLGSGSGEPGLRELKRRATRRSIQLAVLRLTAEHGLDQVTVDDISRDAGVSPRTFFNYFPTKEASLAGDLPMVFDAETAAAFEAPRPDGDPLGELIAIMAEQADDFAAVDPELHQLRRRLVAEYPQIVALKMDRVRAFEALLGASVERRLAADALARRDAGARGDGGTGGSGPLDGVGVGDGLLDGAGELDEAELAERARLMSLLVLTVARAAWTSWLEHPGTTSLRDLLLRSYARLREVTGAPPLR
ncbi:TetR family transcriptional regulator [Herbiconiux liukaitaii]|uniref:TetR family transcriptional regulator n=1 Tax=Herbiconiux liukaitaii TaxID=3342799 RepID=UPI0035B7324D